MEEQELDIEVNLDGEDEAPLVQAIPEYEEDYPELKNLARDMSEQRLNSIANTCIEDFESDDDSRTEWLANAEKNLKVYMQKAKPKNKAWLGASEDTIPVLLESVNQWTTRAISTLFKSEEVVRIIPSGMVDGMKVQRSERTTKHMNWSLFHKNKRWKPSKKALLRSLGLNGSFFTKTFWDPLEKRPDTVNIRPVDLIVPYGTGPRHLDDIERITHRYFLPYFKAKEYYREGYFSDLPETDITLGAEENAYDQTVKEIAGLHEAAMAKSVECEILEQHRYLMLDEEEGIDVPVIVWLCKKSKKVLRIAYRVEIDGRRQVETFDPEGETLEPMMMENANYGKPVNYKPERFFVHYKYADNPEGFYGHGMADFVGPMDISINKMLRQCIDAATLSNSNGGFVSKQLGMRKGNIDWTMGKYSSVDATVDDIRKHIMRFDFKGADPTLLQLMQTMLQRADRLAMTTDALTGQMDKVVQPSTVVALIEQGLQPFTAAMTNVVDALGEELEIIYRLYGKYLDENEYFNIMDANDPMQIQQEMVTKADYAPDAQIRPIADLRMATEHAKVARAEMELNFATGNPFTQQSPPHLYNAFKRFARSMDMVDIDEILPDPAMMQPPQPQPGQEGMIDGQPNEGGASPMAPEQGNPMGIIPAPGNI